MKTRSPLIFCALDTTNMDRAISLAQNIDKSGCGIKIGLEFFCAHGIAGVSALQSQLHNAPLFLDLKLHDIPNTVAGAIKAVSILEPAYINIHAQGGSDMIKAARDACPPETKLLAVTILTSLDQNNLEQTGHCLPLEDTVLKLACLSQSCGLDGIVCSPHEIQSVRQSCGHSFILMVPGIRLSHSGLQDQKRVMTPQEAITEGATHLVIGRPITQSTDPHNTAKKILEEIQAE